MGYQVPKAFHERNCGANDYVYAKENTIIPDWYTEA